MDKSARIRWIVLLSVLAATVAAIVYPVDEQVYKATSVPVTLVPRPALVTPTVLEKTSREIWLASDEDPFAVRNWQVTSPPVVVPTAPSSPQPVIAVAPPPPSLPYRFLGQMQDGAQRVIYLGRGDQILLAHQGDVLETSYKIAKIGDTQIEFESVDSGTTQTLPIPAQ